MTYIGPLPAVLRSCQRATKFFSIQTLKKQEQDFAETFQQINYLQLSLCVQLSGPNHLVQRMSCRISIGHPLDSTRCLVGFYQMSTTILQVCFKCLRIANFIEKCHEDFYTRHSVKFLLDVHQNLLDVQQNCSTGRPLEQKI